MLAFAFGLACSDPATGGDSADPLPTLDPPPAGEGFQVSMSGVAPPNSEVWLCDVYDLPTTEPSPVHKVTYLQTPGMHHLTLSTTAMGDAQIENGHYDCNDLYSDPAMMSEVTMIWGNQGEAQGEMELPDGLAATLPAGIQMIQEVHYMNPTDEEVPVYSYIDGWTMPEDEVTGGIWGGSVRDENIEIPAHSSKTEWSRCVMDEDVDVLFLGSHTHGIGTGFTIAPFDGTTTGDVFYENHDWHDPMIVQYDPGMHVPAGQGFEWSCTWQNDSDETVHYGFASTDEMCNMAVVFTPFSMTAACQVVETSDGVLWEG
jgi:hypothetical protein